MKRSMVKVLSFFVAASLTLGVYFPVPYAAAAAAEGEGFSVNAAESGTTDLKPTGPAAGELAGEAGEEPAALPTTEPTALPGEGQPAEPPAAPSAAPTQGPGEAAGAEPGETPEAGASPTAAPGEDLLPEMPLRAASRQSIPTPVTAENAVAKIGETLYATLQGAIDAAAENAAITLLKDIDGGTLETAGDAVEALITVPAGKVLTLDLAGHRGVRRVENRWKQLRPQTCFAEPRDAQAHR